MMQYLLTIWYHFNHAYLSNSWWPLTNLVQLKTASKVWYIKYVSPHSTILFTKLSTTSILLSSQPKRLTRIGWWQNIQWQLGRGWKKPCRKERAPPWNWPGGSLVPDPCHRSRSYSGTPAARMSEMKSLLMQGRLTHCGKHHSQGKDILHKFLYCLFLSVVRLFTPNEISWSYLTILIQFL